MKKIADYDEILEEERRREAKYDSASEYLERQERIRKEIRRLKRQFTKIDTKKKNLVDGVIGDAAFLWVTMQELQEKINRDGTEVEYKNGENQYGTKQSPDVQTYLQMSQKHTAAIKLLKDCMPPTEKPEPKDDGFDNFRKEKDG